MALSFVSPSYRAASSDLTIAISPLGIVELADEEFEVHGPRLNRYASNWAFYLGHHWTYRREIGEPQITLNYCEAFQDWLTNFTLTNGVVFQSPKATQAIIPQLLETVWTEHQPQGRDALLWEIHQQGGVSGDAFIKVAYEEAYQDPAGNPHPERIRILPLNAAFCFPEYHPHDMTRLIRFKMKYRFWGTALEGTRQVFSYTELWTEDAMQAFINDELIDSQDNPLGVIPFIHIANRKVPSSPWGLSDIQDITDLNRVLNETVTLVQDIVDYYASPTTVIIGAKANALERGPKKVWSIAYDKAKIENLTLGQDLAQTLEYLKLLKEWMHEIVGVPITALGQEQNISNTSGVALQLQFQAPMMKFFQKKTQYESGLSRLNEIIIRTAALYMPWLLEIDEERDPPIEEGQLSVLDPADPLTYRNSVKYMSPLPLDELIALNTVQAKMALGLESKEGALADMGEKYPAEKLQELIEELHHDALEQGALDLLNAQLDGVIQMLTGVMRNPDGQGDQAAGGQDQAGVKSAGGADVTPAGAAEPLPSPTFMNDPGTKDLMTKITTMAAGTQLPQLRNPNNDQNN